MAFGLFPYNMQINIPDAVAPAVAAACFAAATALEATVSSQQTHEASLQQRVNALEAENLRLVAVLIGVQLQQISR